MAQFMAHGILYKGIALEIDAEDHQLAGEAAIDKAIEEGMIPDGFDIDIDEVEQLNEDKPRFMAHGMLYKGIALEIEAGDHELAGEAAIDKAIEEDMIPDEFDIDIDEVELLSEAN